MLTRRLTPRGTWAYALHATTSLSEEEERLLGIKRLQVCWTTIPPELVGQPLDRLIEAWEASLQQESASAMNLQRLYEILAATTIQFRKGELVQEETRNGIKVTTIDAMPHESEAAADLIRVDLEFISVGVDQPAAERHRAELIEILKSYPRPDRLAGGPSYIEVGAEIGDQGAAFQLFALGKVLGLWDVITPASMGMTGDMAREMAGNGFVMITGFKAAS